MDDYKDIVKKSGFERLFEKLSDLLVDKYTSLDGEDFINFCFRDGSCQRTSIHVSQNYLQNILRFDWKRLMTASHKLPALVYDSLRKEYSYQLILSKEISLNYYETSIFIGHLLDLIQIS